jgi:HD-GYP domain-containing protein (c-di-GMP phosphodiesterase class II)
MTDETANPNFQDPLLIREEFVRVFYKILQSLRIHRENNQLLTESVQSFIALLRQQGSGEGVITIRFVRGRLYFQEEKLLYRRETVNLFDNLMSYFEKRGLGGIRFYPRIGSKDMTEVLVFAAILNQAEQKKEPLSWLIHEIQEEGFSWVEIVKPDAKSSESRRQKSERALKTYSYALESVQEITRKLSAGSRVGIGRTLRVTQNMVNLMMEDEPLFLALSTIRMYDDYTYRHSLNVAILSMCIGRRINLSRRSLEQLGLCGLLHDLGKVMVPKHILNKAGKLTPEECEEMKKHVLNSVRQIVKIHGSSDRKASLLLPPFEHHLRYDLSGYPQTHRKEPLSLFGRILAIADVYDAITSPRIYRRSVMPPDQALGMMYARAGTHFDPILLKVFINMVGVYPIGTLLELDSKEFAIVVRAADNPDKTRPEVMLLSSDENGRFQKGRIADLSEKDPRTGYYLKNIIRSVNPSDYGIQPAAFLL